MNEGRKDQDDGEATIGDVVCRLCAKRFRDASGLRAHEAFAAHLVRKHPDATIPIVASAIGHAIRGSEDIPADLRDATGTVATPE